MVQETNHQDYNKPLYWITLAFFVFSLVAGIFGFQKYFSINCEEYKAGRAFYRTLQLFTLEGGDMKGTMPFILQIVRFSAPFTTILAIIMALLEIFNEQRKLIDVARLRNHVVIIGFGMKGKNIMEECLLKKDDKVLVIENDKNNPNLSSIKSRRCRTLIGDATDGNILKRANINKAESVFLLMGDDSRQVKTYLLIYQITMERRKENKEPLQLIMHLRNKDFLQTMRSQNLLQDDNNRFSLSIFNVYENSARELFAKYPPDHTGLNINSSDFVQVIILGFGQTGEALALQTAYSGHYLNGKKPKVLIIDKLANQKVPNFLERYPSYKKYINLQYLELDTDSPQLIRKIVAYINDPKALTTIVLCFDNTTYDIFLGLQLDEIQLHKQEKKHSVFVRMNDEKLLDILPENLKPFALSSEAYSKEVIMERGELDLLAKEINKIYQKDGVINLYTSDDSILSERWQDLPQEYKDAFRKTIDHVGVKIRGVRSEIKAKTGKSSKLQRYPKEYIDILAKLEHKRWSAERSLAGWTFDEIDDEKTKKDSKLVSWTKLPKSIKDKYRKAIKYIPAEIIDRIDEIVISPENKKSDPA